MTDKTYNVLFLCTGNSARSIFAETILNHMGGGRFRAYSAGSYPKGRINPHTLELLELMDMPTDGLRSNAWDEFARPGAPPLDFVFTVCDDAAGEACPVWPGHPATAHWGVPDPAAVQRTEHEQMKAFRDAFYVLQRRIELFASLPISSLDRMALHEELRAIGTS